MAFNGSGVFVRLYNWVTDRNGGIKIQASRMDAEMDGFATGLSNCITKDGQTTVTGPIPMNSQRITGLGNPTADADALNRVTGDNRFGNADWSTVPSVAGTTDIGAATSANVLVTGTNAITGFGTVAAGTRRTVRFNNTLTLTHHATSLILPGSANITTADGDSLVAISAGSGNWRVLDYTRASGLPVSDLAGAIAGSVQNLELTATVGSNALTVALKTAAGADASATDPIVAWFHSANSADGTITKRSITAASSIVVSSGSTLGTTNNAPFKFWVVLFDDNGTLRPGIINCRTSALGVFALAGHGIASSTAEGGAGAADSAHVFYTGSAVTSKPYIVLGYLEYPNGLGTAGTYASGPSTVLVWRDGMKLPGDTVQTVVDTATAETSNSTTGFVVSDLSVAISLRMASNFVEFNATGNVHVTALNVVGVVQMHRDGGGVGVALEAYNSAGSIVAPSEIHGFDLPGTTSSTTYAVYLRSGTGGTAVEYPEQSQGGTVGFMTLKEIMA